MEYKILESNGVENENVDGAELNNALAGGVDGVLRGVLNDCEVYSSGNSIQISTGVLMIKGFRIKIVSPWSQSFTSSPSVETLYQVVAKITLSSNRSVLFEILCRTKTNLRKDNLFKYELGVYESEIAVFNHDTSGKITNVVKTIGFVSSGAGSSAPVYAGEYVLG